MIDDSYSVEDRSPSKSFNDFCVISNSQDADEINKLKADNFNLRLRCYNLYNEINYKSNNNDSIHNEKNELKLNKYLDDYNTVIKENDILKSENKLLKEKCDRFKNCEAQLLEIESLKIKNEKLKELFKQNFSASDMILEILKFSDEQITTNILSSNKILNLKYCIKDFKKRMLSNECTSAKLVNNTTMDQSKFIQDFNESVELSKVMSTGCVGCNALKVNYDKLMEMFMKSLNNVETLTTEVREKQNRIETLEEEAQLLKSEPKVNEEKSKKFELLVKNSLISVVRKDQEKKSLEANTKALVDYYLKEIGELNRKINDLNEVIRENLVEEEKVIKEISSLIAQTFKDLLINDKNNSNWNSQLQQLITEKPNSKSLTSSRTTQNLNTLLAIMNKIFTRLENNELASNHSSIDQSMSNKNEMLRSFIFKYDEITKLATSLADKSHNYSITNKVDGADLSIGICQQESDYFEYSPQYRIRNAKAHQLEEQEKAQSSIVSVDQCTSIYFEKSFLNYTACQSFTSDYQSPTGGFDPMKFNVMLQKIVELGEAIHRYSDLVEKMSDDDESSLHKINRSCSAMSLDSELQNSNSESVISSDSSSMDKKNKYLINEIEIENLRTELLVLKNEVISKQNEYDHMVKNAVEMETVIFEANKKLECNDKVISSLENRLHLKEQEREEIVAEHGEKMDKLNLELKKSTDKNNELLFTVNQIDNRCLEYLQEIGELKVSRQKLIDEIDVLFTKNRDLNSEKSKIENDFHEIHSSLLNMTKSLVIVTEENELIAKQVKKVHDRFSEMSNMFEKAEDGKGVTNEDVFSLLNEIDSNLIRLHSSQNRSEIMGKYIGCEKSLASSHSSEEQKSSSEKFVDLTNITSFNTDLLSGKTVGQGHVPEIDLNMTGFKVKSVHDILRSPEKVLIMLRTFSQNIDDLKRRLKMRYEENKHLRSVIGSVQCDYLIQEMDKFKVECENNNEKVSQRKMKKL